MSDLPNVQPAPNPWLGLGARPAKRNHPRTGSNASSSDEIEAFARPSVQRIVPAAGLPLPVSLPVSLPVITTTPPPTQAPIEEAPAMASNPPATTPSTTPTPTGLQHSTTQGSGKPRQAMLLHLVHSPTGLTRKALVATLGWPWKKVTNTTYHALRAGLCEMDASGAYFITDAGKGWLAVKGTPVEGTPPASTSQPARKPGRVKVKTGDKAVWVDRTSAPGLAARRDKPSAKKIVNVPQHDAAQATAARARVVQVAGMLARVMQVTGTLARPAVAQQASADSTVVVQIAPTFRAAVYTDGSFHLSKAGQSIELTATEHAQLLRFLERMAEAD